MGQLEPGAIYIYEHYDGVTYARKFGAPPSERFAIGWREDANSKRQILEENQLWDDIRKLAESNVALQEELDRVKVLYKLIKDYE